MSTRVSRPALLGIVIAAAVALALPAGASAAFGSAFDGALSCSVEPDRHRVCTGIVETFDGTPIDVNLGIPPEPEGEPDGNFPLVMDFHGWGGSKFGVSQHWLDKGYAYFSMSDRGWGLSCGGQDPKRLTPACANGFNHLLDTRYEVRDAQEMAGLLVDDGIVDPGGIAATGSSYGGGMSMALAALKDRKMLPDDSLVPWTSPDGVPISLAAAAPDIPWTDLAYSLVPTGRTLDYVADAPYGPGKIGVMKQSFVSGLYGLGSASSNYAPVGTQPDADLTGWYSLLTAGEPYDSNPLAEDIVDEVTTHHSSYYIDDSVKPAPLLISNGWTDDLFPPDEAIRFYNRTKSTYPGADISLFFSDAGHQRGQNKGADTAVRHDRRDGWFDYYVKGEGEAPELGAETLTQVCGGDSAGPFQAPSWRQIAPGEIRLQGPTDQAALIVPGASNPAVSQAFDPIAGGGACATASGADQPGFANYRLDPAPAGGYTLMGSATIIADILSPGPTSQLAARLVDIDPDTGEQTLVARALYRPETTTSEPTRQVFQLHPNGYRFAEGHVAKLELMPSDIPYGRVSNGQAPITVSALELRLPVLEQPGLAGAEEPAAKFIPDGFEPAPDYVDGPVDSDGDGVIDGDDDCPNDPAPGTLDGCPVVDPPDSDDDGVIDSQDACPNEPGPASNGGCPTGEPEPKPCETTVKGTNGPDRLRGTGDSERIVGRGGDDRIKGRGGDDCVSGSSGDDRVNGGRGKDQITGGKGKDRIRSRDGRRDVVRCGAGRDRVVADKRDKLIGCEKKSIRR